MLDRAPDRDPVTVGRGHERVRLDRELGDHREGVGALDDDLGLAGRRVDVAPAVAVLVEDVAGRVGVVGTKARVLDERRFGGERGCDRVKRRQLGVLDADEAGRLLGGVQRLGGDGGHRLAVVLRLADRQHRPIAPLRAEPRHRLRAGRPRSSRAGRPGQPARHRHRCDRSAPARRRASTSLTWSASSWGRSATYCCRPVTRSMAADPRGADLPTPALIAGPSMRPGSIRDRRRRASIPGVAAGSIARRPAAAARTASMICS